MTGIQRRGLLRAGAVGALGGAAVGAGLGPEVRAGTAAAGTTDPVAAVPFHGVHQPGVTREVVASAAYVACDVTVTRRARARRA